MIIVDSGRAGRPHILLDDGNVLAEFVPEHIARSVVGQKAVAVAARALLIQLKGKRFNDGTAQAIATLREALKDEL